MSTFYSVCSFGHEIESRNNMDYVIDNTRDEWWQKRVFDQKMRTCCNCYEGICLHNYFAYSYLHK